MSTSTDERSIVNNRYILGERLFARGDLGELFRARDSKADKTVGNTKVLMHFFSSEVMNYELFRQTCQELKGAGYAGLDIQILRTIDCGWTGEKAFFVLGEPDAWSLKALHPAQGNFSSLHQRACAMLTELNQHQLLCQRGLDSLFFVVTPSARLYLLGTALSRHVQALQASPQNWLPATVEQKKWPGYKKSWLARIFLGVSGLLAAGGVAYGLWGDRLLQPLWPEKTLPEQVDTSSSGQTNENVVVFSVLDKPDVSQPSEGTKLAPAIQSGDNVQEEPVSAEAQTPAYVSVTATAETAIATDTKELHRQAWESAGARVTERQTDSIAGANAVIASESKPARSDFRWNGMDELQLLERARSAIGQQRLQSALFFMRILWHNQLQTSGVRQLAQQVRKSYQSNHREALLKGDQLAMQVATRQIKHLTAEFDLPDDE